MNSRNKIATNIVFSILLLLPAGMAAGQLLPGETLPSLKGVSSKAAVALTTKGIFTYSYTVANGKTSTGRISDIDLEFSRSADSVSLSPEGLAGDTRYAKSISDTVFAEKNGLFVPAAFKSPLGWISSLNIGLKASWGAVGANSEIAPGKSLSGFSAQTRGIPGIRKMALTPLFAQTAVDEASAQDVSRVAGIMESLKVEVFTVAPIAPQSLDPAWLIDYLRGLRAETVSIKWIDCRGLASFLADLDDKLIKAEEYIDSGKDKNSVVNQLEAFKSMLLAQRGKCVKEDAYQLLYMNAQNMIYILSGKY